MRLSVEPHPRLESSVELLFISAEGIIMDAVSFIKTTLLESTEAALKYAEIQYPHLKVSVKNESIPF